MSVLDLDARVRAAAFAFLGRTLPRGRESLSREILAAGFMHEGRRVPLVGPQGIFKPAILPDMPLSITTVPIVVGQARPYEDEIGPDGTVVYRYRGTDPAHRDNVGLRVAMARRAPLVYLHGLVPGRYAPFWPVYVVNDIPAELSFAVYLGDARLMGAGLPGGDLLSADVRRAYATSVVRRRLHQEAFRERVLRAYQECCAICRLRHDELLEAAHILPDGHPRGEPIVPNGLALCALHHAAFDGHLLGITPDLTVDLRPDVIGEKDGPMLRHGLQGFQGQRIHAPAALALRPNRDFLAERYELFRKAS